MADRRGPSRVLALWTRALLDELEPSWRTTGLAHFELEDPDALLGNAVLIPHRDMLAVWRGLTAKPADPLFGIHFAERNAERSIGVLAYCGAHAANVGDAIRALIRLQSLLDTRNELRLELRGDAHLTHRPPEEYGIWPAHVTEAVLGAAIHLMRGYLGGTVPLREIWFQHNDHGAAREVATWFGCAVRYDADVNAIVLARESLEIPLRAADRTQFTTIFDAALKLLAVAADPRSLLDAARAAVREHGGSRITLASVARAMRMSSRTLQRRLGEHGTSFRALVDDVRLEMLSTTSAAKAVTKAHELGYADSSSLRRLRRRTRS